MIDSPKGKARGSPKNLSLPSLHCATMEDGQKGEAVDVDCGMGGSCYPLSFVVDANWMVGGEWWMDTKYQSSEVSGMEPLGNMREGLV